MKLSVLSVLVVPCSATLFLLQLKLVKVVLDRTLTEKGISSRYDTLNTCAWYGSKLRRKELVRRKRKPWDFTFLVTHQYITIPCIIMSTVLVRSTAKWKKVQVLVQVPRTSTSTLLNLLVPNKSKHLQCLVVLWILLARTYDLITFIVFSAYYTPVQDCSRIMSTTPAIAVALPVLVVLPWSPLRIMNVFARKQNIQKMTVLWSTTSTVRGLHPVSCKQIVQAPRIPTSRL